MNSDLTHKVCKWQLKVAFHAGLAVSRAFGDVLLKAWRHGVLSTQNIWTAGGARKIRLHGSAAGQLSLRNRCERTSLVSWQRPKKQIENTTVDSVDRRCESLVIQSDIEGCLDNKWKKPQNAKASWFEIFKAHLGGNTTDATDQARRFDHCNARDPGLWPRANAGEKYSSRLSRCGYLVYRRAHLSGPFRSEQSCLFAKCPVFSLMTSCHSRSCSWKTMLDWYLHVTPCFTPCSYFAQKKGSHFVFPVEIVAMDAPPSPSLGIESIKNAEHLESTLQGLKSLRYQSFVDLKPWLDEDGKVIWSPLRIQLARLVFSQGFETTMGFVIVSNLILIMIEADRDAMCYPDFADRFDECPDRSSLSPWISNLNLILLLTYSLECGIRFFVERSPLLVQRLEYDRPGNSGCGMAQQRTCSGKFESAETGSIGPSCTGCEGVHLHPRILPFDDWALFFNQGNSFLVLWCWSLSFFSGLYWLWSFSIRSLLAWSSLLPAIVAPEDSEALLQLAWHFSSKLLRGTPGVLSLCHWLKRRHGLGPFCFLWSFPFPLGSWISSLRW